MLIPDENLQPINQSMPMVNDMTISQDCRGEYLLAMGVHRTLQLQHLSFWLGNTSVLENISLAGELVYSHGIITRLEED